MERDPTLTELLSRPATRWIDVRSPAEFERDHIPEATNVPLLDDTQRAVVGTLYHKESPRAAWEASARILSERIESLVADVARLAGAPPLGEVRTAYETLAARFLEAGELPAPFAGPRGALPPLSETGDDLVAYCWRGGNRSAAFVELLRRLGYGATRLRGGYKTYRGHVRAEIAEFEWPPVIVLEGMTGTGKTRILRVLAGLLPGLVLDLEGMAGHRSSVLGAIGLRPASQPRFESLLAAWFRGRKLDFVIAEGESRLIGPIEIPKPLYAAMRRGLHVLVEAPQEVRMQRLLEEYTQAGSLESLEPEIAFLAQRIGGHTGKRLLESFQAGDLATTVRLLLEGYYDPRYRHSMAGVPTSARIDATDIDAAAETILEYLRGRHL